MNIPSNLKYTKDHEWVKVDGDVATVGIRAIEAVKTVADAFMPVSGEIIEVNAALEGAPQTVNTDPYGEGWMIKIKLTNPAELDELMDADAYTAIL